MRKCLIDASNKAGCRRAFLQLKSVSIRSCWVELLFGIWISKLIILAIMYQPGGSGPSSLTCCRRHESTDAIDDLSRCLSTTHPETFLILASLEALSGCCTMGFNLPNPAWHRVPNAKGMLDPVYKGLRLASRADVLRTVRIYFRASGIAKEGTEAAAATASARKVAAPAGDVSACCIKRVHAAGWLHNQACVVGHISKRHRMMSCNDSASYLCDDTLPSETCRGEHGLLKKLEHVVALW